MSSLPNTQAAPLLSGTPENHTGTHCPFLFEHVDKKSSVLLRWARRAIAINLDTRVVYVSSKDATAGGPIEWKYRMKLYTLTAGCMTQPFDGTSNSSDPLDLLTLTLRGVGRALLDDDLIYKYKPFVDSAVYTHGKLQRTAFPAATPARSSSKMSTASSSTSCALTSVTAMDCSAFEENPIEWELRCRSYADFARIFFPLRELLEVDGLRKPIHAGLPPCDPRNKLQFAYPPIHLWSAFKSMMRCALYTCVHADLVGCDETGKLGVCAPHTYICITDSDVLVLDEKGKVVRWMSLKSMRGFYYNTSTEYPYGAFVSNGANADIVFYLTPEFPEKKNGSKHDAAMLDVVPAQDTNGAIKELMYVFNVLINGTTLSDTSSMEKRSNDSEASQPEYEFTMEELTSSELTVRQFVNEFDTRFSRFISFVPQPIGADPFPYPISKCGIAHKLNILPPQRAPMSLVDSFFPYYAEQVEHGTSTPSSSAAESSRKSKSFTESFFGNSVSSNKSGNAKMGLTPNGESGMSVSPSDGEYARAVPVKKSSKMVKFFDRRERTTEFET